MRCMYLLVLPRVPNWSSERTGVYQCGVVEEVLCSILGPCDPARGESMGFFLAKSFVPVVLSLLDFFLISPFLIDHSPRVLLLLPLASSLTCAQALAHSLTFSSTSDR